MDRKVVIVTPSDETVIGTVADVLAGKCKTAMSYAIRDVVDGLEFGNEQKDYAVITIELR